MDSKRTRRERLTEAGAKVLVSAKNAADAAASQMISKPFHKTVTVLTALFMALPIVTVNASAMDILNTIETALKEWIPILGGMVACVGGIQLAIGFKDDNADGKTRGMQTMIGGAIIIAVSAGISFAAGGGGD